MTSPEEEQQHCASLERKRELLKCWSEFPAQFHSIHPPSSRCLSIKGSFKLHFLAKRVDSKDLYPLPGYYSDEPNRRALPEKSLFWELYL